MEKEIELIFCNLFIYELIIVLWRTEKERQAKEILKGYLLSFWMFLSLSGTIQDFNW